MWQGKKKAITFSFDDGVTQDRRTVQLLNKYGLKATFNLNSGLLGTLKPEHHIGQHVVTHNKVRPDEVKNLYKGHEVAVHTCTHPRLTELDDATVIRQVEEDRKTLEALCGYPVIGMAYPYGGKNNDDRVAKIIRENTPILYSRTITSTYTFELQKDNLLRFNPTMHFTDARVEEVVDKFLSMTAEEPQLLYIWGHSYELDVDESCWVRFETLCKKLSGHEDIFYGTNKETLL